MELSFNRKRIVLSQTDLNIIKGLEIVRYAHTGQIQRLWVYDGPASTNERRTRRLLERLVHDQVVTRLARRVGGLEPGSDQYIYTLGPVAQRLLGRRKRPRPPQEPTSPYLAHTLEVGEIMVRLFEAKRRGIFEDVRFDGEPACWRTFTGAGGQTSIVKPDAFVRLIEGEFEDAWFLEVDRGTEWKPTILGKLKAYQRYYEAGREQVQHHVFPQVLFLVPTLQRQTFIQEQVLRLPERIQAIFRYGLYQQTITILSASPK